MTCYPHNKKNREDVKKPKHTPRFFFKARHVGLTHLCLTFFIFYFFPLIVSIELTLFFK